MRSLLQSEGACAQSEFDQRRTQVEAARQQLCKITLNSAPAVVHRYGSEHTRAGDPRGQSVADTSVKAPFTAVAPNGW